MSNTTNNMQTQTSNTLHNAIMEASGKDRPPMLAPINYVQWKSRIKRYIDTKPNHELIHYCLKNPLYKYTWADKLIPVSEGSPEIITERYMETYKNVSQDIRDQLNAEAEAVQIILIGINNDIFSAVDACPNACEMWKNHPTYYSQNSSIISQQAATRNKGKAIVNYLPPIYDQEPSMVAKDDEIRANQDNSLRINRGTGYESQRIGHVARARETVEDAAYHRENMLLCKQEEAGIQLNAEQADWSDDTDDESKDQELEAHYMPLEKVSNDDNYNVFAIESEHPEQSKYVHNTYPIEQDEHNVIISSLDISYNKEQIDQKDDDDDLDNKRELLASLIEKLKCETHSEIVNIE
nr:hypothetical protein [Tanacetum cinerariifolium]GEV43992.1 hypothetical protein [Tanacetum cinerariifolium]